jgi:hypothetical protein
VRVVELLGANALMLGAGVGLLPLLGIARTWRELVTRCGLAYLAGIVFAGIVAAELSRAEPSLFEAVNVDVKMNGHGQQIVAGYSVRPLPGAPVATPLRWDEVNDELDPSAFTLETVPARVAKLGDLHEALLHGRQRLI